MTSNLKVILSAVGVAALAASPAMAKSRAHHFVPAGAPVYGQVYTTPPYAGRQLVTPYGANAAEPAHETPGPSHDFQLGGEK